MPSKWNRTYKGLHALSLIVGIAVGILGLYVAITAGSAGHVYLVPYAETQTTTVTSVSTETTTMFAGVATVTSTFSQLTREFNLTSADAVNTVNQGTLWVANISGYTQLVIYPPSSSTGNIYIYVGTSRSGGYALANNCVGGANLQQCVATPAQSITLPGGEGTWVGISSIRAGDFVTIVETLYP